MNVLSLFDGMSCGQIALTEIGVKVDTYYASEVEKYPIQVTQHNFPDTIQLGDVRNVDVSKLNPIDLLLGGSPCQSFSFAGKRKGMSTKCDVEIYTLEKYLELKNEGFEFEGQSYLFWEYIRILTDIRKYNPDVIFLLENVEMGKKWERVLSQAIGLFGVHINSALVSAQNRKRIYWTNIKTKQVGLFGEVHSDIPQPKDEGVLLKDILESKVDEKYYLSEKMLKYFETRSANFNNGKVNVRQSEDKATTLTASMASCDISDNFVLDTNLRIKENQNKASNSGGLHYDMDLIVAMRGRNDAISTPKRTEYGKEIRKDYEAGKIKTERKNVQQLEPRNDGKTNCLTSVSKDNLVMQLNPSKESGGQQPYKHNRVYDVNGIYAWGNTDSRSPAIMENEIFAADYRSDEGVRIRENGKAPTLTSGGKDSGTQLNSLAIINHKIRRLTPIEVQRLQTIPSWYDMSILSDTQIYKACGNGWTVDVVKHILSFLI